jgi:hypothetical protein
VILGNNKFTLLVQEQVGKLVVLEQVMVVQPINTIAMPFSDVFC